MPFCLSGKEKCHEGTKTLRESLSQYVKILTAQHVRSNIGNGDFMNFITEGSPMHKFNIFIFE